MRRYIEGFQSSMFGSRSDNLPDPDNDSLSFALACNAYFFDRKSNQWKFNAKTVRPFSEIDEAQRISFFGPSPQDKFFEVDNTGHQLFVSVFNQQPVLETISRFRKEDQDLAGRLTFLFGGIVRHMFYQKPDLETIAKAVRYVSRKTMLGDSRSADATASSMAMYVISGGSTEENSHFTKKIKQMAEAVRDDPIPVKETADLGLSQVARLHDFVGKLQNKGRQRLPSLSRYINNFDGFPTVGAEFHFPEGSQDEHPNFLRRLALFNMSQYQRGSYIQLSRNDRGVWEVRMNPSVYPITIANWNHYRYLLPELNKAFFTITLNRDKDDFKWKIDQDAVLINRLRSLALLCFASQFDEVHHAQKKEEIEFGSVYLGQTVKIHQGQYEFSGHWNGGAGKEGQLSIYAGFGKNLPRLAYYLSMALARPALFEYCNQDILARARSPEDALTVDKYECRAVFGPIQQQIFKTEDLIKAYKSGNRILELLRP